MTMWTNETTNHVPRTNAVPGDSHCFMYIVSFTVFCSLDGLALQGAMATGGLPSQKGCRGQGGGAAAATEQ